MDIGTVRGILTAVLLLLFLGIVFWSYSKKRRRDFDAAAQLPLENGDKPPAGHKNEERKK